MLGDTIAALRKQQGLSQQALADRIFVVRQTISKWEKNLSVPDADALTRLADALDTTVEALLSGTIPEQEPTPSDIAAALGRINDQLSIQNRRRSRIWKIVAWALAGLAGFYLLLMVLSFLAFGAYQIQTDTQESTTVVHALPAE